MSSFNLVCDNCGRLVQGITWMNGMKFCAKCYQETFGASKYWLLLDKDKTIAEQQQRIAELEKQLHELEEEQKRVYPFVKKYDNGIFIEYNVIYEREGLVSTMCFGKNKEMAYKFLKELRGE